MFFPETILLALATLALEPLLGYPGWLWRTIGHPVSWIGRLVSFGERRLNRRDLSRSDRRMRGALLVVIVAALAALVGVAIAERAGSSLAAFCVVALLSTTLVAQRSHFSGVRAVALALDNSIEDGRAAVARIDGRNVASLDEAGVSRAAIESLVQGFAGDVATPAFWLALLGLPGAAVCKAVGVAASMIGHDTARYREFGAAAATAEKFFGWAPARIAAALIVGGAALGVRSSAREAWRGLRSAARDGRDAGWAQAAMAGALGGRLGGPRAYGETKVAGAWIGEGNERIDRAAIRRALAIYVRACLLQYAALALVAALLL